MAHSLSLQGNAQTKTPSWISDFAKLGWKDGDLDWENGEPEESQIIHVVKIERCPFVRFLASFIAQHQLIIILIIPGRAKFFFAFKENRITSLRLRI